MSTLSGEADKEGFAENVRPEVQKALAWLALAGLAVALRDFVGVAFATFVVSYIGNACNVLSPIYAKARSQLLPPWSALTTFCL